MTPGRPRTAKTLGHLARRLVRERHDEDLVRRDVARGNGVGRAAADDAGLAGARAGDDRDGSVDRANRLELGRVQVGEEPIRLGEDGRWHEAKASSGRSPTAHPPVPRACTGPPRRLHIRSTFEREDRRKRGGHPRTARQGVRNDHHERTNLRSHPARDHPGDRRDRPGCHGLQRRRDCRPRPERRRRGRQRRRPAPGYAAAPYAGWGWGWGPGFGFFGFFAFFFFLFIVFGLIRAVFGWGRWGRGGRGGYGPGGYGRGWDNGGRDAWNDRVREVHDELHRTGGTSGASAGPGRPDRPGGPARRRLTRHHIDDPARSPAHLPPSTRRPQQPRPAPPLPSSTMRTP